MASVFGQVFGNVFGSVFGSVATVAAYGMNLELFEVSQGIVLLYWTLPNSLVTFTLTQNGADVLQTTQGRSLITGLLPDTDYAFRVQAATAPASYSRTLVYRYDSRNAETEVDMKRLKPFPSTQLP